MKTLASHLGLLGCIWLLAACGPQAHQKAAGKPLQVVEYAGPPAVADFTAFVRPQRPATGARLLYFYADWCGPCRRFRQALPSEQVQAALTDATLTKVNVDQYPGLTTHFAVNAIPAFLKLGADGTVVARISSDKWGEDVPEEIAPIMAQLAHSTTYDTQ